MAATLKVIVAGFATFVEEFLEEEDPGINNLTPALLDWKIALEYLPRHLN